MVQLELTVPLEDLNDERKRGKYFHSSLSARAMAGKPAASQSYLGAGVSQVAYSSVCSYTLEVGGLQSRRASKNILETAEKALQWLWICRGVLWCATWTQVREGSLKIQIQIKIKNPKHPITLGLSLMTCPSITVRRIQVHGAEHVGLKSF